MRKLLFLTCFLLSPAVIAATPFLSQTAKGVELKNSLVSMTFSNKAELLSIVDLKSNIDIAAKGKNKIAYIQTQKGEIIEASNLSLADDCLILTIGKNRVMVEVKAFNNYIVFEVLNKSLPDVETLCFINLKLDYDASLPNPFLANGIALSLQTNPTNYPSIANKQVKGQCSLHTGFSGAKLAIVACKRDMLWEIIKDVYHSLPAYSVPTIMSGGAFAQEDGSNKHDCVIVGGEDVNTSNVSEWIDFYSGLGVKQINIHIGNSTIMQGQFSFQGHGSASVFKKQISDPLNDAGIITTLHSYSYYISYYSNDILSEPKWQKQLEIREERSLLKALNADERAIILGGDLSFLKQIGAARSVYTPFLLIDDEIVRYVESRDGILYCNRGQCGTKASAHKKNVKVKIIGGYFNYIAPQIGSELFYEIARRTANAYNDGGFRGFYFDALDGLPIHLKYAGLEEYSWYYSAAFVNEVLKNCEKEPLIIEYSTMYPTLWAARGRGECWDTPNRGYKNFIDDHLQMNLYLMNRNYIGILGWYNFYPFKNDEPGDYSTKYMFSDDVDYLGVKAIAYNQVMVYNGLYKRNVDNVPGLRRNLERFVQYNKLRSSDYFSEKVKSELKEGQYEYRLIRRNGKWGFQEASYCRTKIRDVTQDKLVGDNPFRGQRPFIRLENLYTSDCVSSVNLASFNHGIELKKQECEIKYPVAIDMSSHLGLKVHLEGGGLNSKDAICIRLRSSNLSAYADYIVRLNFDGWRDVVVPNLDNAEYGDLKFRGLDDDRYRMHRNEVDFSDIRYMQIFMSDACSGVKLESIDAVPLISNVITNPRVQIEDSYVVFNGTLLSGEYLEYVAGKRNALIYDRLGNSREIKVKGNRRIKVPAGRFTAMVSGKTQLANAPSEVAITIGLFGDFIHN